MKKPLIILGIIVLVGLGVYFYLAARSNNGEIITNTYKSPTDQSANTTPNAPEKTGVSVIGKSAEGRDITSYRFGNGETKLLFVGGIHGGYEWNTSLVAYEAIDYFTANPTVIPNNVQITIVPALNPDGLYKTIGKTGRFTASDVAASKETQIAGRYNANKVDLNRNFDCSWQATGKWQTVTVSGGNATFSEPESMAIKNFIETQKPAAVVVWFSSAGGVFSSSCNGDILGETTALTNLYAKAAGYPAYKSFDFYETTGDMANWLAKINIPAISVLLTTHTETEWTKNQAGIAALLQYYAK